MTRETALHIWEVLI